MYRQEPSGAEKTVHGISDSPKGQRNTVWAKIREQLCFSLCADRQNLTLSSRINE